MTSTIRFKHDDLPILRMDANLIYSLDKDFVEFPANIRTYLHAPQRAVG